MRQDDPIDIKALISASLASLALLSLSGCGCEDFDFAYEEREVLAGHITAAERTLAGVSEDEPEFCHTVCTYVGGWLRAEVETCELTLYEPAAPRRRPPDEDNETTSDETSGDPPIPEEYRVVGTIRCSGRGTPECIGGRRPQGHHERSVTGTDAVGVALAEQAHLEAASVRSFLELAQQLRAWDAPEKLVARCLAAAEDERRHAQVLGALARERGADVPSPQSEPAPEAVSLAARHNATEGCVLETWAALLAHVQTERAATPELRAAFATIAEDETRHAQLAWDLHEWFSTRLDPEALEEIARARALALSTLPELAARQAATLPAMLGLPSPAQLAATAHDFALRLSRTKSERASPYDRAL